VQKVLQRKAQVVLDKLVDSYHPLAMAYIFPLLDLVKWMPSFSSSKHMMYTCVILWVSFKHASQSYLHCIPVMGLSLEKVFRVLNCWLILTMIRSS